VLSALALNGVVLHETSTRQVSEITGLIGAPPVRRNVRVRPMAHGSIDSSRYFDEAVVSLVGSTNGLNGDIDQAISEFRLISTAFQATLETPGLLTWTEGAAGLALQRTVKLAAETNAKLSEAAAELTYGYVVTCADPTAYSQTLQTIVGSPMSTLAGGATFPLRFPVTFAPGGSGTAVFTNVGNAETLPLLRLYGLAVNPAATLVGGRQIQLNGTIAAGEYIEIDLLRKTLTRVNGSVRTSARGMLDSANSQWFGLPANVTTTVQLLAASFDGGAHIEIVGRSAYR
jgi:hypothetical protein